MQALEEAYESALDSASLEAFDGKYETEELDAMIDKSDLIKQVFGGITSQRGES